MIQTLDLGGLIMAERSPLMSMALLFAPTVCVVALRFGLPNIEELLVEDIIAQVVIHSSAIILGIIMYLKYRVVEDHEYHRSSAIKGLSKMYKMEDKGLWGRGDAALERLEAQAQIKPKGRSGSRIQQRMSGRISDLNKEGNEIELDSEDTRMNVDVQVEGIASDLQIDSTDSEVSEKQTSSLSSSAETSAKRRLAKELARREKNAAKLERKEKKQAAKQAKAALKAEKAAARAAAKAEKIASKKSAKSSNQTNWDIEEGNQWSSTKPSTKDRSVISCKECGAVNNSGTAYCTGCGAFL
tara:strand:- start:364 stop:1260 length:897 start_codon:yes stop_codon:yes gene_type:complete